MEQYRKSIRDYWDVQEAMECTRKETREEALMEGREEGRKEGLLEAANNLIKRGTSLSEAAEITGLSIDDIIAYRNRLDGI